MRDGFEGRLQTQTFAVDDLVSMVRSGRVRIPSFQRGIRWSRPDVIKLFQSIVLGYPIGNLLLWQRQAEAVRGLRIGTLTIDSPARDALFVVDGQQRLTSLASALSPEGADDPVFGLVFDTMAATTRPVPPATCKFAKQSDPTLGAVRPSSPSPLVYDTPGTPGRLRSD